MHLPGSVLLEVLRSRLWVIPTVAALLAAVAAALAVQLDGSTRSLELPLVVAADSARAVLATIAGAMISFTALVFSITMLVLQAASTQLSPRVARTFLRDRFNQVVLGLFVATFVYSLLVLASVDEEAVPRLAVIGAVALVLVAVLAFVSYIDHMAHDIRPTSVIQAIAAEARAVIEQTYPDHRDGEPDAPPASAASASDELAEAIEVTWSGSSGYVQSLDRERLAAFADEQAADIRSYISAGSFVVHGQPILLALGEPGPTASSESLGLASVGHLGPERTMAEDPAFGFRLLVDVGLRALSPSLNDHSTATQAIDRLHELLALLHDRRIPSPVVLRSKSGRQVMVPTTDWDDFVRLATSELTVACRDLPAVQGHLLEMVRALLRQADADRQPALRRAQARIEADQVGEVGR